MRQFHRIEYTPGQIALIRFGCIAAFVYLALVLLAGPAAGQSFAGTISASGYTPPPGVWVTWCRAGTPPECRSFQLAPGIAWDGQDGVTKFGRYAGGDASVQGWSQVPAMSGETQGLEVGAALLALYRRLGGPAEYTRQQLWDFGFANSCGSFQCGCSWYEAKTGQPHPINPGCRGEVSAGGSELPGCPVVPAGCGRSRSSPCQTLDPSVPTDKPASKPCRTAEGGRVGRWVIRAATAPGPVAPDPTPPPTDPEPPAAPSPGTACWIFRLDLSTLAHTWTRVDCAAVLP